MVVFFFYNYIRISNMFGDFGMTFGSESAPTVISPTLSARVTMCHWMAT